MQLNNMVNYFKSKEKKICSNSIIILTVIKLCIKNVVNKLNNNSNDLHKIAPPNFPKHLQIKIQHD